MKKHLILSTLIVSSFISTLALAQSEPGSMTVNFSFVLDRESAVDSISFIPSITTSSTLSDNGHISTICPVETSNLNKITLTRANNMYTFTYTFPSSCFVDSGPGVTSWADFGVTIPQNTINSNGVPFIHNQVNGSLSGNAGTAPRGGLEFEVHKSDSSSPQLFWYTLQGAQRH